MQRLSDVLQQLRLSVVAAVKADDDSLFLLARPTRNPLRDPEPVYILYSRTDDPVLSPEEVDAIRRRFEPA